ncbi:hypothetical protein Naga_102395g1 [Nannochloropsis gaditana]|uniref:Uncharacterized protein n=1 Tax=Nannochloropsis gaditana TaxID=72520 RepID=W7T5K3_9STRA|nr:hypothetical protein Naga_102395g1 [Nannochloropsis gaditana]
MQHFVIRTIPPSASTPPSFRCGSVGPFEDLEDLLYEISSCLDVGLRLRRYPRPSHAPSLASSLPHLDVSCHSVNSCASDYAPGSLASAEDTKDREGGGEGGREEGEEASRDGKQDGSPTTPSPPMAPSFGP